jgi:hypothetical protein
VNDLLNMPETGSSGPVECLGQTFPSDAVRREHFLKLLAEKFKDQKFRNQEGFPQGTDEAILAMSDPPYYTACPNPWLADFVACYGKPYDPSESYSREPLAIDVSVGKTDQLYKAHGYHTKVPHLAIAPSILYYTKPGDIVLDGFAGYEVGLGMTIEAGLILRELKLRGMVRRVLVVAPKSLVRQWQAEMRLHFGESFRLIEPAELAALRSFVSSAVPGDRSGAGEREDNLWLMHDQVICSIDSVKPLERRLGNAHLGRFRSLADFDRDWPERCDREAIDELMGLAFLQEAANAILVGPNGVGKSAPSPATSRIRRCWPVTRCCVPPRRS